MHSLFAGPGDCGAVRRTAQAPVRTGSERSTSASNQGPLSSAVKFRTACVLRPEFAS